MNEISKKLSIKALTRLAKRFVKSFIPRVLLDLRIYYISCYPYLKKECPICLYKGYFRAVCPRCESLPRHRLFWLWWSANREKIKPPILHFAPEESLASKLRKSIGHNYQTADLFCDSDIKLDIENLDIENRTIGTIICHHVLEHVDDSKALKEVSRVLAEGGVFICSVPIIEGWEKTYRNDSLAGKDHRHEYFGQSDHLRYYGRDFRDSLLQAGLHLDCEFTAEAEISVMYGLERGEKIFICSPIMSPFATARY